MDEGPEKRLREQEEHREFPDEVALPADQAARQRFSRYRALQSFRSSPWHPRENLPASYGRVYQLQNLPALQKRILEQGRRVEQAQLMQARGRGKDRPKTPGQGKQGEEDNAMAVEDLDEEEEEGDMETGAKGPGEDSQDGFSVSGYPDHIQSGQGVCLEIEGLSLEALRARLLACGHLSVFALLPHENKLSVLQFSCSRLLRSQSLAAERACEQVVRSKDLLLFQTGFRSFLARPLFSEANLNCDKHKFSRFLQNGSFSVASCFGPITLTACPLLVFRALPSGGWQLLATGSLSAIDPDRIVLKKAILTGIPIRVRRKVAVVKHMFHQTLDVRWFKPAELVTKHGLRGVVKEPVGTHGLFKALFSGPITQNDTVLLVLYKRVFPKLPDPDSAGGDVRIL